MHSYSVYLTLNIIFSVVAHEPVKKQPDEVQDLGKISDHYRGICGINPNLLMKTRKTPPCNRVDLETQLEFLITYAQKSPMDAESASAWWPPTQI
jgi:hypothetical protein